MEFKLTAFGLALARWMALVALALVPTVIVVALYRRWRRQPLWSLDDIPAAAEVTLCLAWLSVLITFDEMLRPYVAEGAVATVSAAVLVAAAAAGPVMLGYRQIEAVRCMLSRAGTSCAPVTSACL
ncbi:MAG: hypothetical protein ACT4N2_15525 [Hyphomicrobium sp.]